MNLSEQLIAQPQRENAGAVSRSRVGFQESWALCKLLELHASKSDYLIAFEFHDDVIVLDSATSPATIDFFQVKTRAGGTSWTRAQLIRRKDGTPSILGLLYGNYLSFSESCTSLVLVSNQSFNLPLNDSSNGTSLDRFCLDRLENKELQRIADALRAEHALSTVLGGVNLTHFEVTSLSLRDHELNARGRLSEFLGKHHRECEPALRSLFKCLQDEIRRRSSRETLPASFSELVSTRGISRAEFISMLTIASAVPPSSNLIQSIESRLNAELFPVPQLLAVMSAAKKFLAERLDPAAQHLGQVSAFISKEVSNQSYSTLIELMSKVLGSGNPDVNDARITFGEDYVRAVIVVNAYEGQGDTQTISSANQAASDSKE